MGIVNVVSPRARNYGHGNSYDMRTNFFHFSAMLMIVLTVGLVSVFCEQACGQDKAVFHYIDPKTPEGLRAIFRYTGDRIPFLSAHRGGPEAHLPENHTVTFENTLKHTWSVLEIDPRFTKDSVFIVHHDPTLQRTTTGEGKVADFTYEELKSLYLKDMKGNVTPYRLQTLKEVIEWARGKTILILDQKEAPLDAYISIVEEMNAESFVIIMADSFDDVKRIYGRNKNIMMQVFIGSPEAVDEFDKIGVPWDNIVAFVSHQIPDSNTVFERIHAKGALCILGTSRHLDREFTRGKVSDITALKDKYNALFAMGADILETDIPVEVSKVVFDKVSIHPSVKKYYKTSKR
jgi:glycerophosphoryl diester phosphodiesterase